MDDVFICVLFVDVCVCAGMYLADLTFIDEGNETVVPHKEPLPPGRRAPTRTSSVARDKLRDGFCRKVCFFFFFRRFFRLLFR